MGLFSRAIILSGAVGVFVAGARILLAETPCPKGGAFRIRSTPKCNRQSNSYLRIHPPRKKGPRQPVAGQMNSIIVFCRQIVRS